MNSPTNTNISFRKKDKSAELDKLLEEEIASRRNI